MKTCSVDGCDYNVFSKGMCKIHWGYNYKKPIKKVSAGQAELNQLYSIVAKKFKEENPICQAGLKGCTHNTQDVHHKIGKSNKDKLLDKSNFLAVCRSCHQIIEDMGEEVYELGFKIKRI